MPDERRQDWYCTFGLDQGLLKRRYVKCHGTLTEVGNIVNRSFGRYAFAYTKAELDAMLETHPDYTELVL